MSVVQVSVAIPDPETFDRTLSAAQKVGLQVDRTLEVLGVATGSIDEKALAALHSVTGVGSVELFREYGIPTPVSGRRP